MFHEKIALLIGCKDGRFRCLFPNSSKLLNTELNNMHMQA